MPSPSYTDYTVTSEQLKMCFITQGASHPMSMLSGSGEMYHLMPRCQQWYHCWSTDYYSSNAMYLYSELTDGLKDTSVQLACDLEWYFRSLSHYHPWQSSAVPFLYHLCAPTLLAYQWRLFRINNALVQACLFSRQNPRLLSLLRWNTPSFWSLPSVLSILR